MPLGRFRPQTFSALPERLDLKLYQGDTVSLTIPVPVSIDIDGAEAAAQIRASASSDDIAATFDAVIEKQFITLTLTHDEATGLPTRGVWDCEVTLPDGSVRTIVTGRVDVSPEVTRAAPEPEPEPEPDPGDSGDGTTEPDDGETPPVDDTPPEDETP